jgi:DNA-binding MarR family transcriptional regulator
VSELLDRIQREIRERLEATRAAVLEHERLEAALHALGDAGSRATRAVRGSGHGSRAAGSAQRSTAAAKPSAARASARKQSSAAAGAAGRGASARAGRAGASARRSSGATAGSKRERAREGAASGARSAPSRKERTAHAGAAKPARRRAPRGANREAVLRVIGERPGVTAPELAAASQVTGGTLYTLLRRLTDDGAVEKRELPGGRAGYALATSAGAAAQPAAAAAAATEPGPGVETLAAAGPEQDRADTKQTADDARSATAEAQPSGEQRNEPSDADETPTRSSDG